MNANYKYDVFISYSRKDSDVANKICEVFEANGISFFIDRQGIGGGMEFPAVLAKAIRESQVFLFLASKNSYGSKFTQSEIVYAFNKKQKQDIIPYIIDGSTLPDELEFTFSAINWRQMDSHPIETVLINDVLSRIGRNVSVTTTNLQTSSETSEIASDYWIKFQRQLTGRNLAFFALIYAGVLFMMMIFLTKTFIERHYSALENLLIVSMLLMLLMTFIGLIRPASICLSKRKEALQFYLTAAVIIFTSLFFL